MFKIGDRVEATRERGIGDKGRIGDKGTVKIVDSCNWLGVEFDRDIGGHDLHGKIECKDGHGWFCCPNWIKLIKEATPMINTTARDSVAEALRECKETYAKLFDTAIEAIAKAEKPEEVMEAKKTLLMGLVGELPVGNASCYFCKTSDCGECEYAKPHGRCFGASLDNTWGKIKHAQRELMTAVNGYYSGETYTDPEREKRFAEYQRLKAEFEPA